MSAVTFRAIASGLVGRLTEQMPYLATCRSYAGEESDLTAGMPTVAPACYVMFDRLEMISGDQAFTSSSARVVFAVVIVARTTGGRTAAAEGDEHSAHVMIEDVLASVIGDDLGLDGFGGLHPERVRRVRITPVSAVYVAEFYAFVEVG